MELNYDKMYCLTLIDNTDRQEKMVNFFKELGIEKNIQFWYTCKKPLCATIAKRFFATDRNDSAVMDCTLQHYSMIKTAYDLGAKTVCVLEDDITSNVPIDELKVALSKAPTDFDIIRFGFSTNDIVKGEFVYADASNTNVKLWGTQFYALSRNGMEYYMKYLENKITVADEPFFNCEKIQENKLKYYIMNSKYIHHNVEDFKSDIA